jgi:integrase
LAGAVPPRYRAIILTAAFAGLRFGELAGLRRRNVNLLNGRLTVAESLSQVDRCAAEWTTPKNGKARTVDLPKFLREELARHWERYTEGGTGPEGVVFTGASGTLLDRHNFTRRDFKPAVKRALPVEKHRLRFHDLRHTCAAILIELGTHPKLIADTLGHSSIQITMDRYGHLLERPRAEMLDRLDARMLEVERRCAAEAAAPLG